MISLKKKNKGEAAADPATSNAEPAAHSETPAALPKPKASPDVYTLLLGLSVAALVIATILLYLNFNGYGPNPLAGIKT
jgi:hypothetical protein